MKVVILAGGLGTRLSEETYDRPKPLVRIGNEPIIWHIMKMYESFGFNDFIVCLGYKGNMIVDYFVNYNTNHSNVRMDLGSDVLTMEDRSSEKFKIQLIKTGESTNTAGRIKRIEKYTEGEPFMLTYGDGVSDVNINDLLEYHGNCKKLATLTTIRMPGRFGTIDSDSYGNVLDFREKYDADSVWINGGFFVLEQGIFDYLGPNADEEQWENEPLKAIAADGKLCAYKHTGFWKCMDALRDKNELDLLWNEDSAPWKHW